MKKGIEDLNTETQEDIILSLMLVRSKEPGEFGKSSGIRLKTTDNSLKELSYNFLFSASLYGRFLSCEKSLLEEDDHKFLSIMFRSYLNALEEKGFDNDFCKVRPTPFKSG